MDVEEYVRQHLAAGEDENAIIHSLAGRISEIKHSKPAYMNAFARAVVEEVKNTQGLTVIFLRSSREGSGWGSSGLAPGKRRFFCTPGDCPDYRQNRGISRRG